MAEPRSYGEILARGHVPGRDFRVAFGDGKIDRCLLVAPHGGGISPGTSEIMRAVAEIGGWAWYEFAGFLRQGNREALRVAANSFDEPTLVRLLPQTTFVVAFHGGSHADDAVVHVGGRWEFGRQAMIEAIHTATGGHGIRVEQGVPADSWAKEGVELEFSRGARNLLFPPDASREARGKRSANLRALATAIHNGVLRLSS